MRAVNIVFIIIVLLLVGCESNAHKMDFAVVEFDSSDRDEHCNSVSSPLTLRVTNIFDSPIGIIKHAEKNSDCLDYQSVIHYQINKERQAIGYSRGVSNFSPPETIDTIDAGDSKYYVVDSLIFYSRISADTSVDMSQYFYSYRELNKGGKEKLFSVLIYLSPKKEPLQSFFEIEEGSSIPFQFHDSPAQ